MFAALFKPLGKLRDYIFVVVQQLLQNFSVTMLYIEIRDLRSNNIFISLRVKKLLICHNRVIFNFEGSRHSSAS